MNLMREQGAFVKILFFISVFFLSFNACNFTVSLPGYGKYTLSDTLVITVKDKKDRMDSLSLFSQYGVFSGYYDKGKLYIACDRILPGYNDLFLNAYLNNGRIVKRDFRVFIVSDIIPEKYKFKEVMTLPHDTASFTQGLLFRNGMLFESTGLKGKSELKLIDADNGNVIRSKHTDRNLFNEGISLIGDTLYQLTWKDSVMIVYDTLFNEKYRFSIPVEGWGMFSLNDILYISDGSNKIMQFDPVTRTFTDTIWVSDDKGPVRAINEMEWVKGKIWVNIYGKDKVYVIDPGSGKVESVISGDELIDRKKYPFAGVMNGIAYDPDNGYIYLTGKNWPYFKVCSLDFGE